MAIAMFTMLVFIIVVAAGTHIAGADLVATRDARGLSQAHFVAESAIAEGLQRVNAAGVVNFQNDVVGQWAATWGGGAHGFGPVSGFSYQVTPVASATDPTNAGRLIATANGLEGVRNVVVANVVRSNIPSTSPGAVYLATDAASDCTFNGNAFLIDGNDHNYTGGAGPAPAVPGISARNDANRLEALNSLNSLQKDNVQGLGFNWGPPINASVSTSPAAPSVSQMDQIINDLLSRAGVVTYSANNINGSSTFGTTAAPQITHFTNNDGVTIKGSGNASGAGIMIVEGDLTIQGTLNFNGLVLVRGFTNVQNDPSMTDVTGNATIYGTLWTQDVNLRLGGSAIIDYSTQALALANQVAGGQALPSPLKVISLADCGQVASGVGGCP